VAVGSPTPIRTPSSARYTGESKHRRTYVRGIKRRTNQYSNTFARTEPNASVVPTDGCRHLLSVRFDGSASRFESPRERGPPTAVFGSVLTGGRVDFVGVTDITGTKPVGLTARIPEFVDATKHRLVVSASLSNDLSGRLIRIIVTVHRWIAETGGRSTGTDLQ
jgi:hypothetical protein